MTPTQHALLRGIIANQADDLPRLIYADWCEENGDADRADFVRTQVELARPPLFAFSRDMHMGLSYTYATHEGVHVRTSQCRRERELLPLIRRYASEEIGLILLNENYDPRNTPARGHAIAEWRRGFITSLTLTWQDWRTHEPALYWHEDKDCPETAIPLERVRFTDWPNNDGRVERSENEISVRLHAGTYHPRVTFTRVKCPACIDHPSHICKQCDGTPLNEWRCKMWPRLVFEMPIFRIGDTITVTPGSGTDGAVYVNGERVTGVTSWSIRPTQGVAPSS